MRPPGIQTVTVTITIAVDTDDYQLNYGHRDDIGEYTTATARDAVTERFALLGWASVAD